MHVLVVFMLMMFSGSVLSDGNLFTEISKNQEWGGPIQICPEELLQPCAITDIDCLSQSTEMFLGQTHKGIPDYNIVPIDPIVIPSLDIVFASEGITYKNINLTITGLKNQKISYFKMDTKTKSVILTTQADLHMVSDLIVVSKFWQSFQGRYTLQGSVLGTAIYNYELVTRDGIKYFDVGPETITCEVMSTPRVELTPELSKILANDAVAKVFSEKKRTEVIERAFFEAVEEAYKHVVHNIRAAAKFLPAAAFFNNI